MILELCTSTTETAGRKRIGYRMGMRDQIDDAPIAMHVNVSPTRFERHIIKVRSDRIRIGRDPFMDCPLEFDSMLTQFWLQGRHAITTQPEPNPFRCFLFRFHHNKYLVSHLVAIYQQTLEGRVEVFGEWRESTGNWNPAHCHSLSRSTFHT